MNNGQIKNLIRKAVKPSETWADFGSGKGAFTLALRELGGSDTSIFSLDKDAELLNRQKAAILQRYPDSRIEFIHEDFRNRFSLPALDGLLLANSLHFEPDQATLLKSFRSYLKPGGKLVLVEYDLEISNVYVPYPIPYPSFRTLAENTGYSSPILLAKAPSRYWRGIYSAVALRIE